MKNIIKLFTVMLIILSTSLSVFASNSITLYKSDIDIIFEEETAYTDSQKANIINHFTDQINTITTYSILCLFGHNIKVERVGTEAHGYYITSPRCLIKTYDVSSCSRCDYVSSTLVDSVRIPCCS